MYLWKGRERQRDREKEEKKRLTKTKQQQQTFVRGSVLEQDDSLLLEHHSRIVGEEQVGSLHDDLEFGRAVGAAHSLHVGQRHGLGSACSSKNIAWLKTMREDKYCVVVSME